MATPDNTHMLAAYNRWMNDKLYACAAQLTDAQRKRDLKAFFKSIHGTLNHLLVGDNLWMGRLERQPFAITTLDAELHADFDALTAARRAMDERISAFAERVTAEWLAAPFEYRKMSGAPGAVMGWAVLTHFFQPPDSPSRPGDDVADAIWSGPGRHGHRGDARYSTKEVKR